MIVSTESAIRIGSTLPRVVNSLSNVGLRGDGRRLANGIGRRQCLAGVMAGFVSGTACSAAADSVPELRLGILQFGTVQWVAEVIRANALDAEHQFALRTVTLANTEAGRVALMGRAVDVMVSDWIFVAGQRAAGTPLRFAPFSSATGSVMVPSSSPIRSLTDLAHRRLGVAGGAVDKSWLILRAAAQKSAGIDPAIAADIAYGAPPLLSAKLMQGELDAVLTYWNFAAQLEASGYRSAVSVNECARLLGLPDALCLVGFVFHEGWARRNPEVAHGFLAAVSAAEARLAGSEAEWQQVRPLMNAPDDALFESLRRRFVEGIAHPSAEAQERAAIQVLDILLRTGGTRATGGLETLPTGIFWPVSSG